MATLTQREEMLEELETLPDEYLPFMLQVVRSFKETLENKQIEESIRRGSEDIVCGRTYLLSTLWDKVNAE